MATNNFTCSDVYSESRSVNDPYGIGLNPLLALTLVEKTIAGEPGRSVRIDFLPGTSIDEVEGVAIFLLNNTASVEYPSNE